MDEADALSGLYAIAKALRAADERLSLRESEEIAAMALAMAAGIRDGIELNDEVD